MKDAFEFVKDVNDNGLCMCQELVLVNESGTCENGELCMCQELARMMAGQQEDIQELCIERSSGNKKAEVMAQSCNVITSSPLCRNVVSKCP